MATRARLAVLLLAIVFTSGITGKSYAEEGDEATNKYPSSKVTSTLGHLNFLPSSLPYMDESVLLQNGGVSNKGNWEALSRDDDDVATESIANIKKAFWDRALPSSSFEDQYSPLSGKQAFRDSTSLLESGEGKRAFWDRAVGSPEKRAFWDRAVGSPEKRAFWDRAVGSPEKRAFWDRAVGSPQKRAFWDRAVGSSQKRAFWDRAVGSQKRAFWDRAVGSPEKRAFWDRAVGSSQKRAFWDRPQQRSEDSFEAGLLRRGSKFANTQKLE